MQGLRGAAGGSGIAALAQQMANQGQLATQQASASIGQQEAANQRAMAQGAAGVQQMERQAELTVAGGEAAAEQQRLGGAVAARGLEYQKQEGLLAMASGEMQAANQARQAASDQINQGFGSAIGGVASGALSFATGGAPGLIQGALGQKVTPTSDSLLGKYFQ